MRPSPPDGSLDVLLQNSYGWVAGVDEVGRGALAGPVVVAAVILDPARPIAGLNDSKKLSPATRERLAAAVLERSKAWALASRSAAEVDALNVLEATRSAMREALAALTPRPGCVVSDAVTLGPQPYPVFSEPRADARYLCVAAASILAKVSRDRGMVEAARDFPDYGWERNKGYGSAEHLEALRRVGPSACHRRSFAPLRVLA
ncbi:MAG: ribonuclease HII [Acidobacteriota bacterium]